VFLFFSLVPCAASAFAATDVRVNFTLNTTDENGVTIIGGGQFISAPA
jgi:hypothetical protein